MPNFHQWLVDDLGQQFRQAVCERRPGDRCLLSDGRTLRRFAILGDQLGRRRDSNTGLYRSRPPGLAWEIEQAEANPAVGPEENTSDLQSLMRTSYADFRMQNNNIRK